jgi:pilus assembly protein CpaE
MPELSVVIVAADSSQRSMLQMLVDGTSVARAVFTSATYPVAGTDAIVRRIQSASPDVVLVDIPADNPSIAIHAIELLQQEVPGAAGFAVGSLTQPQTIVHAMRAGAREFIERPTTTTSLLEAFVRLTTSQRKVQQKEEVRGKVFTVVNAKGGSGATTVAVNLALALQEAHSSVALVDIAPLGHTALHMNLKPLFSVADAVRNLHRMDNSLLESYMTRHNDGLQVLAGPSVPAVAEPTNAELARLFDMLVGHFRYVVVDASTRVDAITRLVSNLSATVLLVAHTDVASLWSAARIQQYLAEAGSRDKVKLVLNRFRKIAGFSESDVEAAAGAKLLWKIPNQYFAISSAIDRGVPPMHQNHSELARCFIGLASRLTENDVEVKRAAWSLFKSV